MSQANPLPCCSKTLDSRGNDTIDRDSAGSGGDCQDTDVFLTPFATKGELQACLEAKGFAPATVVEIYKAFPTDEPQESLAFVQPRPDRILMR